MSLNNGRNKGIQLPMFQRNTRLEKKIKNIDFVVIKKKEWFQAMGNRDLIIKMSKEERYGKLIGINAHLKAVNNDLQRRVNSSRKTKKINKTLRKYSRQEVKRRWEEISHYPFKDRIQLIFAILSKENGWYEFLWKVAMILAWGAPWLFVIAKWLGW